MKLKKIKPKMTFIKKQREYFIGKLQRKNNLILTLVFQKYYEKVILYSHKLLREKKKKRVRRFMIDNASFD